MRPDELLERLRETAERAVVRYADVTAPRALAAFDDGLKAYRSGQVDSFVAPSRALDQMAFGLQSALELCAFAQPTGERHQGSVQSALATVAFLRQHIQMQSEDDGGGQSQHAASTGPRAGFLSLAPAMLTVWLDQVRRGLGRVALAQESVSTAVHGIEQAQRAPA